MRRLLAVVGLLVGWNVYNTHQYASLWVHPLPIWSHAAHVSPLKPRIWMNVALGMVTVGNLSATDRAINLAEAAATYPHVLPWDREATTEIAAKNRKTMKELRRQLNVAKN